MIRISMCGRRGLHKLNVAEQLVIGALRLWKVRRAERSATLPELHQRLAPIGGAMLALPLDDFFKQIVAWRNCPHRSRSRYSDELVCDEVATLDLLHAAEGRFAEVREMGSNWNASPLLLISAWILGRQFTTELGLRFGLQPGPGLTPIRDDGATRSVTHPPPSRGADLFGIPKGAVTGADLKRRGYLSGAIVDDPARNLSLERRRQT